MASTDISNLMVISMKEISTKLKLFKVLVNQRINSKHHNKNKTIYIRKWNKQIKQKLCQK